MRMRRSSLLAKSTSLSTDNTPFALTHNLKDDLMDHTFDFNSKTNEKTPGSIVKQLKFDHSSI